MNLLTGKFIVFLLGWLLILSSHFSYAAFFSVVAIPPAFLSQSSLAPSLQTQTQIAARLSPHWLNRLHILSADNMAGRLTQTRGAQRAALYINSQFSQLGLSPFYVELSAKTDFDVKNANSNFIRPFSVEHLFKQTAGNNVVGMIKGKVHPEYYVVVTAHYDHLGVKGDRIFNGADDNASGVVAMLEVANTFTLFSPRLSWIFVATDAEEAGLYGAKAFVNSLPIDANKIVLNLNLDMLAQVGRKKRLYLHGLQRHSAIKSIVDRFIANTSKHKSTSFIPHSRDEMLELKWASKRYQQTTAINWLMASDHYAFYQAGIPYLYLGVAPHALYHTENDTWQHIDLKLFSAVLIKVNALAKYLDNTLK